MRSIQSLLHSQRSSSTQSSSNHRLKYLTTSTKHELPIVSSSTSKQRELILSKTDDDFEKSKTNEEEELYLEETKEEEKDALRTIYEHTSDDLELSLPRNQKGCDLYNCSKEVIEAVDCLIRLKRKTRKRIDGSDFFKAGKGDGCWEVFYAPHIERLSKPFGVKAKPLRYTMRGLEIVSDVSLTTNRPFETQSWWCASGNFTTDASADEDVDVVRLKFDDFWVSLGSEIPTTSPNDSFGDEADVFDKIVKRLGTIGFIESLGNFPVLYFNEDVCVFRFPPLRSNIAARRIARTSGGSFDCDHEDEDNSLDTHKSYINLS